MRPKAIAVIAALCGLLLSGFLAATGPAAATDPLGSVTARNQVMRDGCHRYAYTYRVTPPAHTSTWSTEIFLVDPRGRKVASAYYLSPADALTDKASWRLCRSTTVPGKYTMRMKVTFIEIYDLETTWLKPSTFRITRR